MAVAVDSQEVLNIGHSAGTSPLTWNFTNVAGNYLVVGIDLSQTNPANAPTIGAVSYDGVAMTQIGSTLVWTGDATSSTQMALFGLANPATGLKVASVAFTFSGSPTNFDCIAGAVSFSGVNTSAPVGTVVSTFDATVNGGSKSVNVSTTAGNMVVSLAATGSGGTITGSSPTTITWVLNVSTHTFSDDAAMGTQAGGGTVTAGFTTGVSDYWGVMAVEIKAPGGAAAVVAPSTLTLMGVQ